MNIVEFTDVRIDEFQSVDSAMAIRKFVNS